MLLMGTQLVHLESSVGWHCVILSPRDYSDLKRLLCLLNVQASKQQVVFSKNVHPLMTEKSRFQRIHLTSYERYIYFPLFFPVFHLSSSCVSHTWFTVRKPDCASTAFSFLCSVPWVLTCKMHQCRKDMFFYWMLRVWPCRALGELISPKHCASPFPSPLPCFSGCPAATAPLLMLAAKYISPKTGGMKEWVLTAFTITFLFF